jgi:uncharacterized protein
VTQQHNGHQHTERPTPAFVASMAAGLRGRLDDEIAMSGGEVEIDPAMEGAIGATMFDLPSSEDGTVTVLLPEERIADAPSQSLVRIKSRDGRRYLGVVTAGPFAEPDSLRGDSHMLVTVTARGGLYHPPYHGRIQVSILGEEEDGVLTPPRFRPLPNSPVVALTGEESAQVLRADGDIRLGMIIGHADLPVGIPSDRKDVFPRHTAVLGTTGGGKSTTVSRLVQQAQAAGMAVILLDVEGEYTQLHESTTDDRMLTGLSRRGLAAGGVPVDKMALYHLVGRETANPDHPNKQAFSLKFERLSPYAVAEILGLNDAQDDRFHYAYEVAKAVMRDIGLAPERDKPARVRQKQEQFLANIDEFERGYPRLTLSFLIDIVGACLAVATKGEIDPFTPALRTLEGREQLKRRVETRKEMVSTHASSWGKLRSLLYRLNRLQVFDSPPERARPMSYGFLIKPGQVSVLDLSDTGMSQLSNIVIADLLRGIQGAQDQAYQAFERAKARDAGAAPPARVLIIIEEAHEFLSAERIDKMEVLFRQVATIAKRGRKRWLGLVFVTQLPQHLPRQVLGLVNSYILHKITDPQVVSTLRRTVSGIDDSLWTRLPGLAPGQAIVSFPHLARPLLVSVDPTPVKLRLID